MTRQNMNLAAIVTKLLTEGVTYDNFNTDTNLNILKQCVAPNFLTKNYLSNESLIKEQFINFNLHDIT